jgi:predicted nucleic acid-binding protein
MKLVVDTNVFMSALIKDGMTRKLIVKSPVSLLFPEIILHEVRAHEKEVIVKSGLDKVRYHSLQKKLLQYFDIVPTEVLRSAKEDALSIALPIDKDDALFFAAALVYNAPIWSDDKRLKLQDRVRVLNTPEVVQLFGQ